VLSGILDEGLTAQAAVDRPRMHSTGELVHLEPGFEPEVASALEREGYALKRWDALHHYFGGVSVVARSGAGADPRRSGASLQLR
jgi:gamma-glutamyltranspeptidase/glutathione hydrolase